MKMTRIISTCLALLITTFLSIHTGATESAAVTRGPYIQLATPESVTIVWRSDRAIEPIVRYGKRVETKMVQKSAETVVRIAPATDQVPGTRFGRLHTAPPNTHQYEVTLSNLEADTKYFYSVWDGDEQLAGGDADHYFRTHPLVGDSRPTRIWVVGDSGSGSSEQAEVYQAARNFAANTDKPFDLYLHVGDIAYYSGTDTEFQNNFFDIYQPTLQNTVIWPAMGNHEGNTSSGRTEDGPFYDAYVNPTRGEVGGVPSGSEAYFSFDYGNIHFVCLNSYDLSRQSEGAMAQWLEQDLRATESDWLIAYWHHPPYSKGSHDSDTELAHIEMREQIMPILEAHGVDMVFSGHSHTYERSMLIDGAYATPTTNEGVVLDDGDGHRDGHGVYRKSAGLRPNEGTVHVVTGNGGADVSRSGVMPVMRQTLVEFGSMVIDIEKDTLTARMIGISGEVRDEFHLVKKGKKRRRVVKQPWTPVGPAIEPAGGPFPSEPVTLSQSGYWEGANIHYTLDGSEPTEQSPAYTGPIALPDSELVILKTRSFREGTQSTLSNQALYKDYGADVPRARNAIAVDGDLGDWNQWQGEPIELAREQFLGVNETWESTEDLSANIRTAWTPEGIYFAVSVVDDTYILPTEHMVLKFDSLIFGVDGRSAEHRAAASQHDGVYTLYIGADAHSEGYRAMASTPDFEGYTFATQQTPEGYAAELFVPFSSKLFPDQGFDVGREIQLLVVVVERDGARPGGLDGLYWGALPDFEAHGDPAFWKPVKLGD